MSLTAVPQTAAPATTPVQAATPYLALNIEQAVASYRALAGQFGTRAVHYAVKANPHPALVAALVRAGSRFDVASAGEVGLCLDAGAAPADLIFSNPVKRRAEIAFAYARGVRCFVADATSELHKLAAAAPDASVLVRLVTSGAGSDLPQSAKFGTPEADLPGLLQLADALGLEAAGVAFHVGSQQRDPRRWELPIAQAARIFAASRKAGLRPYLLDVGGGLPARHEGDCPDLPAYAGIIAAALDRHFDGERPELIVEPGRGIVGDAGTLVAEVIGITWRNGRRWVTVDVGFFSGLVEAMGEEIRYRLSTDRDGDPSGPAVLAGPTCDSVDLLYEKTPVSLPLTLSEGDRVLFHSAGAYTSTCSSVGFNGFPALPTVLA